MPAQWTGDIVRKMHIKQITNAALAKKAKGNRFVGVDGFKRQERS